MYTQLSLFDLLDKPKFDPVEAYALKGSGFYGGINRIKEFFKTHADKKERVAFLKKEYGTGGFGCKSDEPNKVTGANYDASGHEIRYNTEHGISTKVRLPYEALEKTIDRLIAENRY